MKQRTDDRMNKPMISIITVVLNGKKHLEQAIKSVIGQTYDNIEYLVIDGQSSDGTQDIIRTYEKNIDFWTSEPDSGIFDAMNKGIEKSSGEYIGILNADDWYETDIVAAVVDKINSTWEKPTGSVIYCDHYLHDDKWDPHLRSKKYSTLTRKAGMAVSHQAMFIPREVYENVGLYDLRYRLASDYDFLLRMIRAGVDFQKLEFHGVTIRRGGQSTVNLKLSVRETGIIVKKNFGLISKAYLTFLFTNWIPSLLGRIQPFLYKYAGEEKTNALRRLWRRLRPKSEDMRI
jgi:glycosyltransferase involved in cell wall biosynthesis